MSQSTLYDGILSRRSASAKLLAVPGPDPETLRSMLFAASRAPDHGRLVPFRFILIEDEARPRFADILAAAALAEKPGLAPEEVERAREKAFQGPTLVGFVVRVDADHPKIPASDQWLAAGCALENLLLACQHHGFGAAVRSGKVLETAPVREGFGLGANEMFAAFLAIGTPTEWPPAKPKPELESLISRLKA